MTERTPYRARVHAPGEVLEVQPYDFESPELISGDARTRLDAALEAWGRQIGMLVTAKTRVVVDVATAPSRIQSFGAFIATAAPAGTEVPPQSESAQPGLDPVPVLWATASSAGGRVLFRVPLEEARYWAARMLGAAGDGKGAGRPLTAVERGLARQAVSEQLAELHHATGGLFAEPVLEAFGTEPPSTVDRDAQAVVAVVGTLRKGERRQLSVALDADLVLEQLGAVSPRQVGAEVTKRLTGHLALAPIEIALRFTPTRVGPDTVLDLAEGDLIPLAHLADRPLLITLDGETVLHAAVGGNGDRLACVVLDSNGGLA